MGEDKTSSEEQRSTQTLPPPRDGDLPQLRNYRILQKVGEGGMGIVYEAEQEAPVRRRVALKVVKWGMDTKAVVARFEAERQALALMNHRNVARVFDAGATEEGRPYFVMEYVSGVPITEHCDRHRLTTPDRLELFLQVCEGVQHAHQKGIIHRDIKPSNILVEVRDGKATPKIIDFGVAKATEHRLTERTLFTEFGQLVGTPEYMSPEQAEMTHQDIDTRTDVYSLGAVLYELLVGTLPLDPSELRRASYDEIRRRIREEEPSKPSTKLSVSKDASSKAANRRRTDPRSLERQLRGDLDWITMKALEKDRVRRYGSPSDLAADIQRHLKHEAALAGPPSVLYRATKFVRRHRFGVGVAAAFVVLLLGFAVVMATQANRIAAERDRANQEAETATRVSEFLTGLFQLADPREPDSRDITARELLDRGANSIETELDGQPLVQARLLHTLGVVYEGLGAYEQSARLLRRALEMKREQFGDVDLDVAHTLHALGVARDLYGDYEEAEQLFRQSLGIKEALLGPDDPEVGRAANSLAIVYYNQRKFEDAEPLLQRALSIKEQSLGPDHADVGSTAMNLGVLYQSQRRYDEAEPLLQRALTMEIATHGAKHPSVGAHLNNLGMLYAEIDRFEDAEDHYLRCLEVWEETLGEQHSDVGIVLHNLGNLYRDHGQSARAEHMYERSLVIWEKTLDRRHPYVATSLRERAMMYRDEGRHAEAEDLYRRSIEIHEEAFGPDNSETLETLRQYAELLRAMGAIERARSIEARLNKATSDS